METKDIVIISTSCLTLLGVVINSIVTYLNGRKTITIETKDQEISYLKKINEDTKAKLTKADKSWQNIARYLLLQLHKEALYVDAIKAKQKEWSSKSVKTIRSEFSKMAKNGEDKALLITAKTYSIQKLRTLL